MDTAARRDLAIQVHLPLRATDKGEWNWTFHFQNMVIAQLLRAGAYPLAKKLAEWPSVWCLDIPKSKLSALSDIAANFTNAADLVPTKEGHMLPDQYAGAAGTKDLVFEQHLK